MGVWNAEAGRAHHRLVGHSSAVRSLALSPGGGLLASGGDDLAIRVSPRGAFGPLLLFFLAASSLNPRSRRRRPSSDSRRGHGQVWNVATGRIVYCFDGLLQPPCSQWSAQHLFSHNLTSNNVTFRSHFFLLKKELTIELKEVTRARTQLNLQRPLAAGHSRGASGCACPPPEKMAADADPFVPSPACSSKGHSAPVRARAPPRPAPLSEEAA